MEEKRIDRKYHLHRFLCPHCLDYIRGNDILNLCEIVNAHNRLMHPTDTYIWVSSVMKEHTAYVPPLVEQAPSEDDLTPYERATLHRGCAQTTPKSLRPDYSKPYIDRYITPDDRKFLQEMAITW